MEQRLHSVPAIDGVLERMESGIKERLEGVTLRDLVLEQEPSGATEVRSSLTNT